MAIQFHTIVNGQHVAGDHTGVAIPGGDETAIHDDVAGEISAITEKATPVAADLILIEDSAASNAKKRVQIGNLPGGGGGGAMVLITQTVLGADTASFDFTSIPATYESLKLVLTARGAASAAFVNGLLRLNNDSAGNYQWQYMEASNTSLSGGRNAAATAITFGALPAGTATANKAGQSEILIPGYARTVFHKSTFAIGGYWNGTAGLVFLNVAGEWAATTAIDRVTLLPSSGNWLAGSVCSLYGIE